MFLQPFQHDGLALLGLAGAPIGLVYLRREDAALPYRIRALIGFHRACISFSQHFDIALEHEGRR